jgi:hypothetical protein
MDISTLIEDFMEWYDKLIVDLPGAKAIFPILVFAIIAIVVYLFIDVHKNR